MAQRQLKDVLEKQRSSIVRMELETNNIDSTTDKDS
jgi:hypothetical protein